MPEYAALQRDYAKYRLDKSKEDLEAAHLLFSQGSYRIANNRAYYSIFHALRAVLVFDNFDSSKHSGVIAEFRRRYIKEGVFPIEMSKMIGAAFTIRNASDYDDMFIANRLSSRVMADHGVHLREEYSLMSKQEKDYTISVGDGNLKRIQYHSPICRKKVYYRGDKPVLTVREHLQEKYILTDT